METSEQPGMDIVRQAFSYQNRFAASTMVFKIDFPVTEDKNFPYLMKDIAMLAKSGIKVIIVPGCKEAIDKALEEHKINSVYSGGERITTEAAIPFVEMASFHVATHFITALSASRVDAVIGNFVRSRGRGVLNGVDMEYSGTVDKIYCSGLKRLLDLGMVPILPCIGWSPVGKPYNVPSNEIAFSAACALGALKLFIITAGNILEPDIIELPMSVEKTGSGRITRITRHDAEKILALNDVIISHNATIEQQELQAKQKTLSLLRVALNATKAGVERVHFLDGCEEGSLMRELYLALGAGTMLYADEYESIRGIRNSDIPDILHLMEPLIENDVLIRRSAEDIQNKKDDYSVFAIDGSIHACGALHDWGGGQAEIAALAVDKAYSEMRLGRRMTHYLIEKARKSGFRRVFVLTTRTQDWFELLGFYEDIVESLPAKRREKYDRIRASKVFALDL